MAFGDKVKQRRGDVADRVAALSIRRSVVERNECADRKRRDKLEADPVAWLKHYLSETYYRPFEKPHLEIIAGVMEAHETSGKFVVAAERGIGKSVVLWGMILYLSLTGKQRFPVCIPWQEKAKKQAFRFWKNALCYNSKLLADYPEICAPFNHAKGIPQRVATTTWEDTLESTGAQLTVGEGLIALPGGLGCIGGSTINGNPRGLNHPQDDGTVLRPSIILLDDVQDRKVARSAVQINETINVIDGDVAGCGEAGRDMPMLMACNCIMPNDVSAHYLTHPQWKALRVPCVERWPDEWDDDKSDVRGLWEEMREKLLAGRGAKTHYKTNKAVMTKGMVLSAPAAFEGADDCPDAFYGVIRMYYRMGHDSFMAERQQEPVDPINEAGPYTLTSTVICSKTNGMARHERPDWATQIVASTDVNPSYALSTAKLGFGADQSAAVLAYSLYGMSIRGDTSAQELARQLFGHLVAHGKELASQQTPPDIWVIDAGGANFDAVLRFCMEAPRLVGITALPFTGRAGKNYNEYGKTYIKNQPKREQIHVRADIKMGRHIRWAVWHADYWREIAQRAWLGDVGAPGSVSIYKGNHIEFATQVAAEKLMGKGEVGGRMMWNWHTAPGKHDFGDVMAQAFAAAAFQGIGTGGEVKRPKRHKRRVSHVKV